ncbi:hypothetical protein [Rhabdothermincola salaria]|uniref:hypothetical protein n=1 Tax=Rhabdothermincola salaria TaxID=2903142 RepID=UPI001E49F700|nr:hypothetical protein [Rhabdothermincola salaria]MCD9623033.1 hypothetical protein [Rhabdothermincola salaria]
MPGSAVNADEVPEPPDEAFVDLYDRLAKPFDVIATTAALTGMGQVAVGQIVGSALATGAEAQELLGSMSRNIRSLATSLQSHNERCIGELRGPVQWSETMSARASSFGDRDLFVCATPTRAYDIDENQVLVAGLTTVVEGARAATEHVRSPSSDPLLDAARRAGNEAKRWLDHPSLSGVSRRRPGPRALRRTRSGKHRGTYEPALAVLDRAAEPLSAAVIAAWRDQRTRAQHRVVVEIIRRLERGGRRLPELRVERGALFAGPVQYHHNRRLGDHATVSGITIGRLLVDVPARLHDPDRARAEIELAGRSGGRPTMVIMDDADLDVAVARAVELATTPRR